VDPHLTPRASLLVALVLLPVGVALLLLRPRSDAPQLDLPPVTSRSAALAQHFSPGQRREAPRLHGRMLQGAPSALTLGGQVTVINFWASWCAPCKREAAQLEAYAASADKPHLIGVDTNDTRADALAFMRRYHLSFPNLSNPDGSISFAYAVPGLPTTIVVDARGRIAALLAGPQTVLSLTRAVARAKAGS
jgi:thiol-disulfide isomerase/thioredoxin